MSRGFFESLFDLSFSEFIATRLVRAMFGITVFVAGLFGLFITISGLSSNSGWTRLASLVIGPVGFMLTVIWARLILELMIVVFRIADHSRDTVALLADIKAGLVVPHASLTAHPVPSKKGGRGVESTSALADRDSDGTGRIGSFAPGSDPGSGAGLSPVDRFLSANPEAKSDQPEVDAPSAETGDGVSSEAAVGFCAQCGARLMTGHRFCHQCGSAVV